MKKQIQKRIQELIEECSTTTTEYFDGRGNVTSTYFDQEKFAKLIIKETVRKCAELVEDSKWNLPRGCSAADQAKYVKEHFGVK